MLLCTLTRLLITLLVPYYESYDEPYDIINNESASINYYVIDIIIVPASPANGVRSEKAPRPNPSRGSDVVPRDLTQEVEIGSMICKNLLNTQNRAYPLQSVCF